MIILAIDPGSEVSAWMLYSIVEKTPVRFDIWDNLNLIYHLEKLETFKIAEKCTIEMVACYGMPVGKDVFETCAWIGRFEQAFGIDNCIRIFRKDIKMHLCNSMRAKDSNVRQALLDKYPSTGGGKNGIIGTKKSPGPLYGLHDDLWSALAIAITYSETRMA